MDFWVSERRQVRTLQASLHKKTLIYSAFSVFYLSCYWLIDKFTCQAKDAAIFVIDEYPV